MADINVYGIPGKSVPSQRRDHAPRKKTSPYHLHALAPGEHKQPDYLARHPFGRVPAFEHDGFAIYETQAILRYLDDVFPDAAANAGQSRERARG